MPERDVHALRAEALAALAEATRAANSAWHDRTRSPKIVSPLPPARDVCATATCLPPTRAACLVSPSPGACGRALALLESAYA